MREPINQNFDDYGPEGLDSLSEVGGEDSANDYGNSENDGGNESDLSVVDAKAKKDDGSQMACYDYLKILNMLLYNGSLCLAIGYVNTSKFNSKFVYYMFAGFLVMRPALLLLYSMILCLIQLCQNMGQSKGKTKGDASGDSADGEGEEAYGSEVEMSGSEAGFDGVSNKEMDNSYISDAPHRRNQVIQNPGGPVQDQMNKPGPQS